MLVQELKNDTFLEQYKKPTTLLTKAQDFVFTRLKGVGILRVNTSLALFSSATSFKVYCDSILEENFNVIIDLNRCQNLDSAFLGAIVLSVKNSSNKNLKIRLVMNDKVQLTFYQKNRISQIFETFDNVNDALDSYQVDNY